MGILSARPTLSNKTPPERLSRNLSTFGSKLQEVQMTLGNLFEQPGRGLAVGAAMLAAVGFATAPRPAHAGGIGPGAAVGIGLGAFALGSAVGAAANPYYNPYYYPYGYYYPPAPAYYPSAPYYHQPRSCWDAYNRRYYAC
jgi:hypothetical protein